MKTLLWAVAVLYLEVLLISGYFAVVDGGQVVSRNVTLALLVGTVSVVMWLGFDSGFGQALKRLLLAVVGCVIVTYSALVVAAVVTSQPRSPVRGEGRTWKPPQPFREAASRSIV
jgi:hypothetical protein